MAGVEVRKNDQVRVIAGRDKGKSGRVLSVNPERRTATVEHVNTIKRHTRPNPQKQVKGGIVEREGPISVSNLMVICKSCEKPTRVGHRVEKGSGKKAGRVRICKRCQATLD